MAGARMSHLGLDYAGGAMRVFWDAYPEGAIAYEVVRSSEENLGEVVYRTTPEAFAAHLDALVDAGAHFIGGCCGTTPAFVEALRARLEGLCGGSTTEGQEG